jgi:hypothetical protein
MRNAGSRIVGTVARSRVWGLLAVALVAILAFYARPMTAPATANQAPTDQANQQAYATTQNYVIRFYPRFMTYFQSSNGVPNRLVGPIGMGPEYGVVVAINDDTLYASAFVDVSQGPQILTIPKPGTIYSLLTLDVFGNVFSTNIPSQGYGTYALVPHGYSGSLPANTTRVEVPYPTTVWIFRADKYSSTGQNLTTAAEAFRTALRLASLPDYLKNPRTGRTTLLPLATLAYRMKAIADEQATTAPTGFLRYIQQAVAAPSTQPLDSSDQTLIQAFNNAFANANAAQARGDYGPINAIAQATRDAHALIVDHWLSHTDSNRWIHFDNVGKWGTAYLDRASLNEYIQYGNDATAAKYYDAFTDHLGAPLDGSVVRQYQLTFSKDQIPDAQRFWSLTAYIPPGVTLVPNAARKWVVAGYTPGLKTNRDGSITIYIAPRQPVGAPRANWLPVPSGPFSLLLRVYGPQGNTSGTYSPPPIKPYGQF